MATSVDTSNKNFQNSQNHIVVVFSGSHDIEISADFSDVSWFTDIEDYNIGILNGMELHNGSKEKQPYYAIMLQKNNFSTI